MGMKREDTSVSLHPLSFREAVKKLTETPPEKRTKRDAPSLSPSQNVPAT